MNDKIKFVTWLTDDNLWFKINKSLHIKVGDAYNYTQLVIQDKWVVIEKIENGEYTSSQTLFKL